MAEITLSEKIFWSSRSRAKDKVCSLGEIENKAICINFSGVEDVSPSFLNEIFSNILKRKGNLKNLKFINQNDVIKKRIEQQKKLFIS